ncbi:hypothetical protein Tco_1570450 [Tanacetum coccineum]
MKAFGLYHSQYHTPTVAAMTVVRLVSKKDPEICANKRPSAATRPSAANDSSHKFSDEEQAQRDLVKRHKERSRDQAAALAYDFKNPRLAALKARYKKKLEKPSTDTPPPAVVNKGQVSSGQQRRRKQKQDVKKAKRKATTVSSPKLSDKIYDDQTIVENPNLSRAPSLDRQENKAANEEVKIVGEIVESKVVDQTSDAQGDMVTDLSTPVEMAVTGILQSGGSSLNSMQETLAQVILVQEEIQKHIPLVGVVQITEEGKRIEAEKNMEKLHKADASWARYGEEFAKMEKLNQERNLQVSTSASVAHKDALVATEKMLKKEIAAPVAAVGRAVTPMVEKAIFQVTNS